MRAFETSPELSVFEFSLIIVSDASARCTPATGVNDMTPVDHLFLRHVDHRGSEAKLGEVARRRRTLSGRYDQAARAATVY